MKLSQTFLELSVQERPLAYWLALGLLLASVFVEKVNHLHLRNRVGSLLSSVLLSVLLSDLRQVLALTFLDPVDVEPLPLPLPVVRTSLQCRTDRTSTLDFWAG